MTKVSLCFFSSFIFWVSSFSQEPLPYPSGNQIVKHSFYTLSYSEKHEQAEWVFYKLSPNMLVKNVERSNNFRPDPDVSSFSASLADYKGSGYDRGHLCPAGDMSFSFVAMSESFFLSNMSPQVAAFNRGAWKNLESLIRYWSYSENVLYVVTGGILNDDLPTIGINKVSVPMFFYKVVYAPQNDKMIAFIMPNEKCLYDLQDYAVSVDSVETVTGIDFFYILDDKIENSLEENVNISLWKF